MNLKRKKKLVDKSNVNNIVILKIFLSIKNMIFKFKTIVQSNTLISWLMYKDTFTKLSWSQKNTEITMSSYLNHQLSFLDDFFTDMNFKFETKVSQFMFVHTFTKTFLVTKQLWIQKL